jgi:G3E family GTPase
MRALRRELKGLHRVLIETTGLADPAPVIHTLMAEPFLSERYRLDGVVTAVDVTHALDQLADHNEAVRQVAMADRLLLTKCDLASERDSGRPPNAPRAAQPGASQVEVRNGEVALAAIFGCGLYDPDRQGRPTSPAGWPRKRCASNGARRAAITTITTSTRHDAHV